jgi:hypothetical protein
MVRALDARVAGLLLTGDPTAALVSAREAVALHEPEPTRCVAPVVAYACLAAVQGSGSGAIPWTAGDSPQAPAPMRRLSRCSCSPRPQAAPEALSGHGCARAQTRAALAGLRSGPVLSLLLKEGETGGIPDLRPLSCPPASAPCSVPCPVR